MCNEITRVWGSRGRGWVESLFIWTISINRNVYKKITFRYRPFVGRWPPSTKFLGLSQNIYLLLKRSVKKKQSYRRAAAERAPGRECASHSLSPRRITSLCTWLARFWVPGENTRSSSLLLTVVSDGLVRLIGAMFPPRKGLAERFHEDSKIKCYFSS